MEDDEQEDSTPPTYADLFVEALVENDESTLVELLQFAAVMRSVEAETEEE